jgi:anti-repressor protein
MNTDIKIFKNSQFGEVKVTEVNGELHFVAKDVAEKLGYKWNGTDCIKHVPEEWRGVSSVLTPSGTQKVITLSEQGLYFFLARSDKPAALPFQKWIAGEVIPSIRRTSGYMAAKVDETPEEIMARALFVAQDTINRQKQRVQILEDEKEKLQLAAEEQRPKVWFADSFDATKMLIGIGDLAKLLCQKGIDIGQNRLFSWMVNNHYMMVSGKRYSKSKQRYENSYMPTQKAAKLDLFFVIPRPIPTRPGDPPMITHTVKVTGKGVKYFVNKFLYNVSTFPKSDDAELPF